MSKFEIRSVWIYIHVYWKRKEMLRNINALKPRWNVRILLQGGQLENLKTEMIKMKIKNVPEICMKN